MFSQLVLFIYSGHLEMKVGEDCDIKIKLTDDECTTLRGICEGFYQNRQAEIGKMIRNPLPALVDMSDAK